MKPGNLETNHPLGLTLFAPGVNVELNAKGDVLGFEMLRASRLLRLVVRPLYRHLHHVS